MKNESLIVGLSVVMILAACASIFMGAIQPLARAQNFIEATRAQPTTVTELENGMRRALDYPSYVGGEEVAKFLGGNIRGYVGSEKMPEEISRELLNFIAPYMEKDNVRHLMMMGQMHIQTWATFKKQSDYDAAVDYYVQARKFAPKVYPVLLGLLSIYNAGGRIEEAKEVGAAILALWPTDPGTLEIMGRLPAK